MNLSPPILRYSLLLFIVAIPLYTLGKGDTYVDSLKQELSKVDKAVKKVDILLSLAHNRKNSNCEENLSYANEALDLAEKKKYLDGVAKALCKIAEYYEGCEADYDEAIKWYRRCNVYAKKHKHLKGLHDSYSGLADCYTAKSLYPDVITNLNEIIQLKVSAESKIQAYGNLGVAYKNLGDYTNAIYNYQQAYNLLYQDMSTNGSSTYQDTLNLMGLQYEIGNIYKLVEDYDRAMERFEKIKTQNKQVNFVWFDVLTNMGLGDCYIEKEDYRSAIKYYQLTLELFNSDELPINHELSSITYERLGYSYLKLGYVDSSYNYAMKALVIAKDADGQQLASLPAIKTTLARVYSAKKQYNLAIDYAKEAIHLAEVTSAADLESIAWDALSNIYKKAGRHDEALEAYQKHIALDDSLYSRAKLRELTRIDMQGSFDRLQFRDSLKREEEKAISKYKLQRQQILTYSGFTALALLLLVSFLVYRNYKREKKANKIISHARDEIAKEKQVSEQLLLNILPEEVATELKHSGQVTAQQYDDVTVLFTDFVNFTKVGERLSPKELVEELHTCFKAFDEIIDKYNIEKIKTIGDAYLAVAGLPIPDSDHAVNVVKAAIEICEFTRKRKELLGDRSFDIRVGINSGTVIAGIVGMKKFAYDIWGDTVNIAARMEQTSEPGKINISEHTHELVAHEFTCIYRGEIAAKNKGNMKMYFIEHQNI